MAVQPKYILNDLENDIFATVVSQDLHLNLLLWQQIFLRTSLHICIFFKTFDQCDMKYLSDIQKIKIRQTCTTAPFFSFMPKIENLKNSRLKNTLFGFNSLIRIK